MKAFLGFLAVLYVANFGIGYLSVRTHKPEKFCRKVIGEASGWNLAAMLLLIPGEANACLDLGYWPLKVPPYVSEPGK